MIRAGGGADIDLNVLSSNAALRSHTDTENQTESSNPESAVVGILNAVVKNPSTIETLNREIRNLEQTGESFAGQLDTLREQRDELIKSFTGNSSVGSYDVDVVGRAQVKGTTYNHETMQLDESRMFQNLHRPSDDQIPNVNAVRELPWESATVNGRVDTLISIEGLSADAAIVIAMTERPTSPYSFL